MRFWVLILLLLSGPVMAQERVTIAAGSEPNPIVLNVWARGDRSLRQTIEDTPDGVAYKIHPGSDQARGNIPTEPTLLLTVKTLKAPLILVARCQQDTLLAVQGPDGAWNVNDDGAGKGDPGLTYKTPQPGLYKVYVGCTRSGVKKAKATLIVAEDR